MKAVNEPALMFVSHLHREDTPAKAGVQALGVLYHVMLLSDLFLCLLQSFVRMKYLFGAETSRQT